MKTGVELIAIERQEQIEKHNWTKQHDIDEHDEGSLVRAALAVVCDPSDFSYYGIENIIPLPTWGIELQKKLQHDPIHRLKVAGALIAAEIDRLQAKD